MKDTKTLFTDYNSTDKLADELTKKGNEIICISYGFHNSYDLILYVEKKTIPYEKLIHYDTHTLYRMRNCISYFESLTDDTQCDICDILYDRYCERIFEGEV